MRSTWVLKDVQGRTTVQQSGQNHQSRTRASSTRRASSSQKTQLPSDWETHDMATRHTDTWFEVRSVLLTQVVA